MIALLPLLSYAFTKRALYDRNGNAMFWVAGLTALEMCYELELWRKATRAVDMAGGHLLLSLKKRVQNCNTNGKLAYRGRAATLSRLLQGNLS